MKLRSKFIDKSPVFTPKSSMYIQKKPIYIHRQDSAKVEVYKKNLKRALYSLKRDLYTLKRALYTLKRALYTLKRALYTFKRALYTCHLLDSAKLEVCAKCQKSPIYNQKSPICTQKSRMNRDLQHSRWWCNRETYIYEKTYMCIQRDLGKRPTYMTRDLCIWKETYIYEKNPMYMKRDLQHSLLWCNREIYIHVKRPICISKET